MCQTNDYILQKPIYSTVVSVAQLGSDQLIRVGMIADGNVL